MSVLSRVGLTPRRPANCYPNSTAPFVDDLLVRYGIAVPTDEERLPPGDLEHLA